ncbi:IS110 family transposase [Oscillospiraceae bacterium OttesenSCG-928-G22]|nr:IS110 family transposase [Oscillospiraceae bacterium OttesenSCG-928-G22]
MAHRIERVTENTLIVGIDIAKRIHWAQITDSRGVPLCKPIKVENTADGFDFLSRKIGTIQSEQNLSKVMLGFEPSGHYWRTLAWYLKTEDICLLGVNPYHVKQLKELEDNAQTKSDKKDALVIAHLIRDGRYFDVYMPEQEYADLRILRRHRDHLGDRRKGAMNHVIAVLDEYFPEYEVIGFQVGTISARSILRATPFPSDILQFDAEQLRQAWLSHGKRKNSCLSRSLAMQFIESAKTSIGITSGITAARIRLNNLLDILDLLDQQIKECEQEMDKLMASLDIAQYLTSVPGVGTVTAAGFIAETGDLSRFDDWKQIRKMAGLNLVEQSSGQHRGKTRISKRGRPALRCIIYIIGDRGMLVSPEMQMYYQYLRHRPVNQLKHQQAVLAVGLKLMRIMFHVVKYKDYYDPAKSLGEERLSQIHSVA